MSRPLIIIPTYNERENLPLLLEAVRPRVPDAAFLVVDDNSPDGTGALADEIARTERDAVSVLHREKKEGLGRAYLAGFEWALAREFDPIVQMDCDFSHRPEDVPRLLAALSAADVALGSRYVKGGGVEGLTLPRKIISKGGSLYARLVLGVRVRDLTGGFKAWRKRTLEAIGLGRVGAQGFGFQVEMTYRALRQGFRVVEVPIFFPNRTRGASKMTSRIFLEALLLMWKLRFTVKT